MGGIGSWRRFTIEYTPLMRLAIMASGENKSCSVFCWKPERAAGEAEAEEEEEEEGFRRVALAFLAAVEDARPLASVAVEVTFWGRLGMEGLRSLVTSVRPR
jgi:hypothetical protein